MRAFLSALVAACVLNAGPVFAQPQWNSDDGNSSGWWMKSSFASGQEIRDHRGRDDRRLRTGAVTATHWYGGEWAQYNNRSWASDSYNDWWHDRPDRAYPRWLQNNQNCARIWSSGGGWRC